MQNLNEYNDAIDTRSKLSQTFLDRMKMQFKDQAEYDAFLASYDRGRTYGLRYNPLKLDRKRFLEEMPFSLRKVPWAEEGFYYEADEQPGKSIFHEAGAFYIQEPSAMAVVSVLDPKPGERILDLCAAPGGKSTHIAGRMQGQGLLVSNEIVPPRAKTLSRNIERMGAVNCVVCREEPRQIAAFFPAFFDRVLVDAPCSGEGMFRKDDTAIAEWSPENVSMCAARQRDILEYAAWTVCPGGVLVYSTCTFSTEENEGVISSFTAAHPEFAVEGSGIASDIMNDSYNIVDSLSDDARNLNGMIRFWPHRTEGEGHFIARLRKADGESRTVYRTIAQESAMVDKKKKEKYHGRDRGNPCIKTGGKTVEKGKTAREVCENFLYEELNLLRKRADRLFEKSVLYNFGEALYLIPGEMIPLAGLQIERPGLQLGFCSKDRFIPSHALAMCLHPEDVRNHYELTYEQAKSYLRGETFAVDTALKGWHLLSVQGCSIGFGKAAGGQMKNHYPKGLRKSLA